MTCLLFVASAAVGGDPPKLTVKFKGKNAAQWAEQLYNGSFEDSYYARYAMGEIGKESFPYFVKGASHKADHVRSFSIGGLADSRIWMVSKEELKLASAIVQAGLSDKSKTVRRTSASVTSDLMIPECIDALKKAHAAEKDSETKEYMSERLEQIKLNMKPKKL